MDELYAAAKKEGQVVFGGAIKEEHVQKLAAAFNKRYPGIAVKYTRRSTEPMVQLVEAERRANRVSFDVLNLTEPGDVVRWMKQGFLAAVPIPDTDKMLPDDVRSQRLLCRDQRHADARHLQHQGAQARRGAEVAQGAGDRPEMEGQGRDLAADPRRHRRAAR